MTTGEYRESCISPMPRIVRYRRAGCPLTDILGKYVFSSNRVCTASRIDPTSDLAQAPRIPTALAAVANWSDMWTVTIRIGIPGDERRILRATSSPFRSGIWKSNRMTSGRNSCTPSIASAPVLASPQTCQELCCSRMTRRLRRTAGLSSTTRIRTKAILLSKRSGVKSRRGSRLRAHSSSQLKH